MTFAKKRTNLRIPSIPTFQVFHYDNQIIMRKQAAHFELSKEPLVFGFFRSLFADRGQCKLLEDRLILKGTRANHEILFSDIIEVTCRMAPRHLKPLPIYFLEITFSWNQGKQTLSLLPYRWHPAYWLPTKGNKLTREWLELICARAKPSK